jgi:hypothetical protein
MDTKATMMTKANMTAYSTDVGPSSSRRNRIKGSRREFMGWFPCGMV